MSAPLTPEQQRMLLDVARVVAQALPRGSEFYIGVACPGMPGVQSMSNVRGREVEFLRLLLDSHASEQVVPIANVFLRRCEHDCPVAGPMNGCACGAAKSGRPFSANHWCGCSCHLPVSTTSGGPTL